jgi:hypothetical protein
MKVSIAFDTLTCDRCDTPLWYTGLLKDKKGWYARVWIDSEWTEDIYLARTINHNPGVRFMN